MRRAIADSRSMVPAPADDEQASVLVSPSSLLPADDSDGGHVQLDAHQHSAPVRLRPMTYLAVYAEAYHQTQQVRMRVLNACRMAVRDYYQQTTDEDITDLSDKALNALAVLPMDLRSLADMAIDMEKAAGRALKKELEKEPLWAYFDSIRGIGPLFAGKLIAWLPPLSGFANVAKLWQYCGHGDPLRSKKKAGEKLHYSPRLKTVVYLIALWQIKARGPYRRFYDAERAKWSVRPWCGKCNPAGSKKAREHCTDGHANGHALRIVGKEFLAGLWEHVHVGGQNLRDDHATSATDDGGHPRIESQRLSAADSNGGQPTNETHGGRAPRKKRGGGGQDKRDAHNPTAHAPRKKSAA